MQVNKKNGLEPSAANILTFQQLWSRYVVYWPLYLVLVAAGVAGAWVYLKYTVPLYQSNARILIKDEKKGADDSKAMETFNLINTKKIIDNEVEVIQSRTLILGVVKELGLYAQIFEKTKFRNISAYVTSPVSIEVKQPDSITGVFEVPFAYNSTSNKVVINNTAYLLNEWVNTPFGTLRFVPNKYYKPGTAVRQLRFSLLNPKLVVLGIQGVLEVTPVSKPSTILNLAFKDEVPQRADDILNGILAAYNRATIDDKNSLAANTLQFVEERLNHVAHDLDSIEKKLQYYKNSQDAVEVSAQGHMYLQNISENDQKLSSFSMQLAALDQIERYVVEKDNKAGIVPSTLGIADPTLGRLTEKLYESELQYERMKKTYAENNPAMTALREQISSIRPSIMENIRNQRRSLEASRGDLLQTNDMYAAALSTIPKKEREIIDMNREESIRNDIYIYLLKKREETALSYASTVADSRVVDRAETILIPVSPKRSMIYVIAAIGALVLGLGFITARETFNSKVLYRREIETMTLLPVIGEIMKSKQRSPLVTTVSSRTLIAEQFRKLRVSLNFIGINSKRKKLMVTSSIPGEGKSFVAANLALSMALTGKKVVLVNLDLHSAALDEYLQLPEGAGVADYLTGSREPEEVIRKTSVNENLFAIGSGSLPENPSELIMNERVGRLVEYLDNIFDFIIIDTPPTGMLTDAYVIAASCDATLYIVRHKVTPKTVLQRLDENNRIGRLTNVGIVFNGIQPRGIVPFSRSYDNGYQYPVQATSPRRSKRLLKKA